MQKIYRVSQPTKSRYFLPKETFCFNRKAAEKLAKTWELDATATASVQIEEVFVYEDSEVYSLSRNEEAM